MVRADTIQTIQKRTKSIRRTKTQRRYCHKKRSQRRRISHDVIDCIKESERQLNNVKHNIHLEHDPITENNITVNQGITPFKKRQINQ